jgi:hypothetical protein
VLLDVLWLLVNPVGLPDLQYLELPELLLHLYLLPVLRHQSHLVPLDVLWLLALLVDLPDLQYLVYLCYP